MRRYLPFFGAFLALAALLGGVVVASAQQAGGGPALTLIAGQGEGIVSMNGFVADPALGGHTARVAVGTTVTWVHGSDEPHTVTFLAGGPRPLFIVPQPDAPDEPPMINPVFFFPVPPEGPYDGTSYINSGLLEARGEASFSVTFAAPGRYPYVCLLHPEMTGLIEVVPPGSEGITSQAAVDELAARHMAEVHDAQVETILATRGDAPRPLQQPDGGSTWFVRSGTDWRGGHLDVLAFMPDNLTIRRGDTVVWYIDHRLPHTVTFVPAGEAPPEPFVPVFQESGPPRLVLGPGAQMARPSAVHDPAEFFNSGLFGDVANQTLGGAGAWTLTFDTPGTYEYFCYLHAALGMRGTITVEE